MNGDEPVENSRKILLSLLFHFTPIHKSVKDPEMNTKSNDPHIPLEVFISLVENNFDLVDFLFLFSYDFNSRLFSAITFSSPCLDVSSLVLMRC